MPKYICHLPNGNFIEWSTVVDAPVTFALPEDAFRAYMLEEYGRDGTRLLDERMARAREKGTSARGMTLADVISGNHAGENGSELTLDEIVQNYGIAEEPSGRDATL